MKNNNIPKIRFPEFTDAWEKCKLGEVANIFDNLRIPVTASERIIGTTPYYGANGIQDYVDGFTHQGEFVLIAEDGANDIKNYPCEYVEGKIWVNNHAHVLSGKKNILDNPFLTYRIKSMDISPYLVGGGRAKLNAKVMLKIELSVPTLPEQQKIGTFFRQLDTLITLHKRKWDEVILLKKALLQKMFPKNGSDFPEIRFPEFTHAWEKCKLGDCGKIVAGGDVDKNKLKPKGKYPVLANALTNNGIIGFYDDYKHTSPAVTITGRGDIGYAIARETNFTAVVRLLVLKPKRYFDIFFLENSINLKQIYIESTGVPQLTVPQISQYEIPFPSLAEQQKIGTFFRQLDRLITLHKRQHEHYQRLKKALLQQMFV
ncbi:restriction endonuclease subunit S [Avibacterium sp. 20-15]|uniref:restriction endonuclease subunit S n=1 Tax=Avibacterium sp. 20-15 TaxID=2911523 RepID=UPI00224646B1|nr:restriction endonuclease subunit S [Avibacterium sp. 20-15]MCW9732772.1 restriction endonuclease subunit S [Avibacterium sp. 20-15]